MTPQRSTQALSSGLVADLRRTRRDVRREQFGLCVCGRPVAWHFDNDNRRLACTHIDVVSARYALRRHREMPPWSDEDTDVALVIFSRREY